GVNEVGTRAGFPTVAGYAIVTRQAEALRQAAVARIERTPTADQTLLHCTYGLICRHVPFAVEVHAGRAVAVGVGPVAEAQNTGNLAKVIRMRVRAVDMPVIDSPGQPVLIAQMTCPTGEYVIDPK